MGSFIILLILYVFGLCVEWVFNGRWFPSGFRNALLPKYTALHTRVLSLFDRHDEDTISRIGLIELAFRNMKAKKTRTIVTIGGMTIGIGAIVLLVSIGYGLQQLVITRVARLSEMKQVDITPQPGGTSKITDKTIADVLNISNVKQAMPLIAVVGRVTYQNSISDMAVYGVTADYLTESAIKPIQGKIFASNNTVSLLPFETSMKTERKDSSGEVAGVSTELNQNTRGDTIRDVDFTLHPGTWTKIRSGPTTESPIIGYTRRVEGTIHGIEVWGGVYDDDAGAVKNPDTDKQMGKWIKSEFALWEKVPCTPSSHTGCESGGYVPQKDTSGMQSNQEGYIAEVNVSYQGVIVRTPNVLGENTEATDSAAPLTSETTAIGSDGLAWVDIASEAGVVKPPDVKTVTISDKAVKQAVVNKAMIQVLGLKETEAVGKKFSVSFVVVGNLLSGGTEKVESAPSEYTIVGITPDDKTPLFYVPFIDLRSLGIVNFSQMKVIVNNQSDLTKARRQIESMGFVTQSVADTVAQINALFATARAVLALLGFVALSVAALGMFNTLTVSLLERTREVGLMKAMGMKSSEVQELFMTESMIMGFFGGVIGLIAGILLGKLCSLLLSFLSVAKGVGFIDISYVPLSFVILIIGISFVVGIATGIYPARRATQISALNALRYE